jgi:hypothetical protein
MNSSIFIKWDRLDGSGCSVYRTLAGFRKISVCFFISSSDANQS